MIYLRMWLVVFLVDSSAVAQVCAVGSTEPPAEYANGVPNVWPKTNVYAAPQYVGYVDYFVYCGYITGVNGQYFSCPSFSQDSDIQTSAGNWSAASSSNGSTVSFNFTSDPPNNTFSCSPIPCFPTYTPYVEFIEEEQADIDVVLPGASAVTSTSLMDYGCQSPACPYQVGPYYRENVATVTFSDNITNDHFLQYVAAHEIGHTMMLGECDFCDTNSTVMTTHTIPLNDPNQGRTSPGYCDNLQIGNSDVALRGPSPFKSNLVVLASRREDTNVRAGGMPIRKRAAGSE